MSLRLDGLVNVAAAESVFLGVDSVLHEAAVGSHDPPPRPVDAANPAALDLKDRLVELHDDPSVPAAVDPLPRALDDPGRQPPTRAQAKLKSMVDQVGTPVVQDGACLFHLAAPGSRHGMTADGTLEEQRTADQALVQKLLDGHEIPVPPPIVKDRQHPARSISRRDHGVGLDAGERHHLVNDAVFARVESTDGEVRVRVVRSGDHDKLHGLVIERLVQALVSLHVPEPHRLGANLGITRHDPMKRQLWLPPDERTVKGPSRQAMTHHDCRNHV